MLKKSIIYLSLGLLIIAGVFAFLTYQAIFGKNIELPDNGYTLELAPNTSLEQLSTRLYEEGILLNTKKLELTAKLMKYGSNIRTGRFQLSDINSNVELIRFLRTGSQATTQLVLNNVRTLEDLSGKIASFILADSLEVLEVLTAPETSETFGTNLENVMSYFIPNTYEIYWSETPQDIVFRMKKEHQKFWRTNNRLEAAKTLGLSPEEVYTLASIVEKETNQDQEKSKMAGALLNRLNINMALQADPTAIFATRDFTAKRVLNKHTQFDSPYNTYMYPGLPPGPIAMASISSIDAVLNPAEHQYLYYCAKGDGSGLHNFATNLRGHNRNSKIYVQNLKKRGKR